MKTKQFTGKALSVDLKNRTVRHFITTSTIDDDGDVLLPRGCDMSRFLKSRTVFDVHEYGSQNVIGTCKGMEHTATGIIATTRFTPRPPEDLLPKSATWWPDVYLWMHKMGDISGWSVGFEPLESREPTKKDRSEFGESDRFKQVHSKWRLLEYSQAPIPTNEDALNLAIKSGRVSKRVGEIVRKGQLDADAIQQMMGRKQIVVLAVQRRKSRTKSPDIRTAIAKSAVVAIQRAAGRV